VTVTAGSARFDDAVAFACGHETDWPRDPHDDLSRWGVHHDDPPPYNRLRGPVHPRGPASGVVWQHGRELIAWGEPDRADLTFSVAKTYLALLAGVAAAQGLLTDVDQPVCESLSGIGFDSAHNRRVTWLQLLQQTSEWEGSCFGIPDTVDRNRKVGFDPRPPSGRKGDARPLREPGTWWEYNDVRINQLSLALLHLFERPLAEVWREQVMQPIGASGDWAWRGYDDAWAELPARDGRPARRAPSVPGGSHWGGGVSIGARDQARIGQLLLSGGRIDDVQVIPQRWIARLSQPCPIAPFYGLLTWLNRDGRSFPGASASSVCMVGAGGHLTWVEPACDAVVVARWLDPAATAGFVQRMAEALIAGG